jgi:hypothetical protein
MMKMVERERDLIDYHILQAHEMPQLKTIFVETFEPSSIWGKGSGWNSHGWYPGCCKCFA